MGANVGHVAVLHRDPLVVVVTLGRLEVPARHVEQGCDVKVPEIVLSGSMVGTTEVEEGQNLYRFTLKKNECCELMQIRWEHETQPRHKGGCETVTLITLKPGS